MCQLVQLVDDDDLERLLLLLVELHASGNLLDELLDDHAVVVVCLTRCDLQMVHGREDDCRAGRGGS